MKAFLIIVAACLLFIVLLAVFIAYCFAQYDNPWYEDDEMDGFDY